MTFTVEPIQYWECDAWFLKKHYARRLPNMMHTFGLYDNGKLHGVISYGLPASPHLCRGICGDEYAKIVLELNRLVIDHEDKNAASRLIAGSLNFFVNNLVRISGASTPFNL